MFERMHYLENLVVLGYQVAHVVRQRELARSERIRDQVVVVDEVIAAEGDQN